MSWSVSANGTVEEVRGKLSEQFKGPLAEKPAGLYDDGERRTVEMVRDMIDQCLATFGPGKTVKVTANGTMAYDDWEAKGGKSQTVNISIQP